MTRPAGDFDDALVVDWSGAAIRGRGPDSCWIASGPLTGRRRTTVVNPSTRAAAMEHIDALLTRALERDRRVLVAIDVSFGLPAGAAGIMGLDGRLPWRALWSALAERIEDDIETNANNRFAVADALNAEAGTRLFWGRPISTRFEVFTNLSVKDRPVPGLAENPLPRLRRCEQLAGAGVISNWMLVGKGSVGGQMLTCLPHLERLRARFGDALAVWPFDGPADPGSAIVLAETWHALFGWRAVTGSCRDEQQVRGTLEALRSAGTEGRAAMLAPTSLLGLSAEDRAEIVEDEGWTLGIL